MENYTRSDFFQERITYELTLSMKGNIMDVFNSIILFPDIPFAKCNNFYKILKSYEPPQEWIESEGVKDEITLYIKTKEGLKEIVYTEASVFTENDNVKVLLKKLEFGHGRISEDTAFELISKVFQNSDIEDVKKRALKGYYDIKVDKYFLKFVLADMVMNNTRISEYFDNDEKQKTSKDKTGITLHYESPEIPNITFNIANKSINNKKYIRVKIYNAGTVDLAEDFIDKLINLLKLYNNNEANIISEYQKFLPNINIRPVVQSDENEDRKRKEGLIPGQSRICGNNGLPNIVSDERAEELEEAGFSVLRFPKENPINYECSKYKENIYPGLKEHYKEGESSFLICCYKKDQRKAKNKDSLYHHYYFGNPLKRKGPQQGKIKTDKFLDINIVGTLPDNIQIMLGPEEYERVGSGTTTSSVIDCLNKATNQNFTREDLRSYISICKQEMYDKTSEEIDNIIRDTDVYLDPKFFLGGLETLYNVNIYITSKWNNPNGEISLPSFTHGYYKNTIYDKSVILYEHTGSERDRAEYPRCEVIRVARNKLTEFVNPPIKVYYDKLIKTYCKNINILDIKLRLESTPKSQIIDSFGKCRGLVYDQFILHTSPCQPLAEIPEYNDNSSDFEPISSTDALEIFRENFIIPIAEESTQYSSIRHTQCLKGESNNIIFEIDINNERNNERNVSVYDIFNKNRRNARYIKETFLYMFSNYTEDDDEEEESKLPLTTDQEANYEDEDEDKYISRFLAEKIQMDESFVYEFIPKTFSESSIIKNGKIIINSEELLRRLIYVLKLSLMRDRKRILSLKDTDFINDYYLDITDFEEYNSQVILQSQLSVYEWINRKYSEHRFYEIPLKTQKPYYIVNNKILSDTVQLAQNSTNLTKSIFRNNTWQTEKYNIYNPENATHAIPFNYYTMSSAIDVKTHISGKRTGIIAFGIEKETEEFEETKEEIEFEETKEEIEFEETKEDEVIYTSLLPINE